MLAADSSLEPHGLRLQCTIYLNNLSVVGHFVSRYYGNDLKVTWPYSSRVSYNTFASEMTLEMANGTDLGHCVLVFELRERRGKVNTWKRHR